MDTAILQAPNESKVIRLPLERKASKAPASAGHALALVIDHPAAARHPCAPLNSEESRVLGTLTRHLLQRGESDFNARRLAYEWILDCRKMVQGNR